MVFRHSNTIVGLVDASGAGGVSSAPSDEWYLVFHFAAWRDHDSEVRVTERRCEMPVAKSDLRALMNQIKAYQIVEVAAASDSAGGVIKLSQVLQTDVDDAELKRIADELQTPVIISHPVFGKLEYERKYGWYSGKTKWGGRRINLTLSCKDPQQYEAVLSVASTLFHDQKGWSHRVNDYAVEQLLRLKNDSWQDEEEAVVSRESFLKRMRLQEINVDESGNFTFWHDDGDMFGGHSIQISGNLATGLNLADIPG